MRQVLSDRIASLDRIVEKVDAERLKDFKTLYKGGFLPVVEIRKRLHVEFVKRAGDIRNERGDHPELRYLFLFYCNNITKKQYMLSAKI